MPGRTPTHWTYREIKEGEDLQQGDIIELTPGVIKLCNDIHPHFADDNKYLAFQVLTQGCDLVRRDSDFCKSKFITLSAVKQFDVAFPEYLDRFCKKVTDGVYLEESKHRAKQFVERILNQNEQAHGLFFLHQDADAGIAVHSLSLLQVSIAFKSDLHYEEILSARRGGLRDTFQAKLGWLVGNLYSRVGTPDWHDTGERQEQFEKYMVDLLKGPNWVPGWIKEGAEKKKIDIKGKSIKELKSMLQEFQPPDRREKILQSVVEVLKSQDDLSLSEDSIETIKAQLLNNLQFRSAT
jgi:hypothetical protein